jgi:hypothetical protein
MKVIATSNGKTFRLLADGDLDLQLLDALDGHRHAWAIDFCREKTPNDQGFVNVEALLAVDASSPQALRHKAASECLSALGQLVRLGLGEAARHGHVGPNAADPQAQKEFSARLEKLELVLESIRETVIEQGAVLKEMQRAHQSPSVGGAEMVASAGTGLAKATGSAP